MYCFICWRLGFRKRCCHYMRSVDTGLAGQRLFVDTRLAGQRLFVDLFVFYQGLSIPTGCCFCLKSLWGVGILKCKFWFMTLLRHHICRSIFSPIVFLPFFVSFWCQSTSCIGLSPCFLFVTFKCIPCQTFFFWPNILPGLGLSSLCLGVMCIFLHVIKSGSYYIKESKIPCIHEILVLRFACWN